MNKYYSCHLLHCILSDIPMGNFPFINFNLLTHFFREFLIRFFLNNTCYFLISIEPQGLNLANVVREARSTVESFMNGEREHQTPGGRSLISLVVANQGNVNEADSNFASEQLRIMREILPDLRFIFWTGGSPNRFERFVREPARDLYQLRIFLQGVGGESIQVNAHPVIHRIQQEPRRIINHRCVYIHRHAMLTFYGNLTTFIFNCSE